MGIKILAIAGPTASGKTALSIELAKRLRGEIVSFDSMQIYRGMDVGTAKPTEDEKCGIPHHMIDIADPMDDFSCADYVAMAKPIVADVAKRGRLPILCGGTGLYLNALTKHSSMSDGGRNDSIREKWAAFAEKNGADALHGKLAEIDPQAAEAIHPGNVRRVIRAIEIFETTGITKTEWDRRSKESVSEFDCATVVIEYINRDVLYERIDRRVDIMMNDGLEEEVRELYSSGKLTQQSSAAQAIGYKEFGQYLAGQADISSIAEQIKMATRRYAKRQITWFKREDGAIRVYPDEYLGDGGPLKTASQLADEVIEELKTRGF